MSLYETIYDILTEEKIGLVATLPCNKFSGLIAHMPDQFIHVPLSREENGVGISAGFYLTGGKPFMMIQASGLGNSLNALMSLHKGYQLPLPILVSWRGRENDKHRAQIPWGKSLPGLFNALGVPHTIIEHARDIKRLSEAIQDSYRNSSPHVILVDPEIWGTGANAERVSVFPPRRRVTELAFSGKITEPRLTRYEAILAASDYFDDAIVLATIGKTCSELYHAKERDLNFYVVGAMGQASSIGLGMALNTRKRVYVLDGDGSLLMNPGILCEIAVKKPANLTIVALDNGTYSTTGEQQIPSYAMVDLELIARSFGIVHTRKASTKADIAHALAQQEEGPKFLHIPIKPGSSGVGSIPLEAETIRERFMNAVSRACAQA